MSSEFYVRQFKQGFTTLQFDEDLHIRVGKILTLEEGKKSISTVYAIPELDFMLTGVDDDACKLLIIFYFLEMHRLLIGERRLLAAHLPVNTKVRDWLGKHSTLVHEAEKEQEHEWTVIQKQIEAEQ